MYASARLVLCGRSLAAASIFLCTDSFELCYGLNKLYTASTGYTGNYKPSGHGSALAALGSLQQSLRQSFLRKRYSNFSTSTMARAHTHTYNVCIPSTYVRTYTCMVARHVTGQSQHEVTITVCQAFIKNSDGRGSQTSQKKHEKRSSGY